MPSLRDHLGNYSHDLIDLTMDSAEPLGLLEPISKCGKVQIPFTNWKLLAKEPAPTTSSHFRHCASHAYSGYGGTA